MQHNPRLKPMLTMIRKELRAAHDPLRAVNEKRYLKSPHEFYGVKVPVLRKLTKSILKQFGPLGRRDTFKLSKELWRSPWHQEKTIAIMVLALSPDYLDIKAMPTLQRMVEQSTGWDHLDAIATGPVADVLKKDPAAFERIEHWAKSKNHWVRRAALICQIPLFRKGLGDRELFFRLADGMIGEREFFIRKAIGWTVREMSKSAPVEAMDYLLSIKGRASGLTLREGAKRLPEDMRKEVSEK